jgi:hypothetical protein
MSPLRQAELGAQAAAGGPPARPCSTQLALALCRGQACIGGRPGSSNELTASTRPESTVIGLSLLQGGAVSLVAVIAIFLSNIPEGLSSSAGMKKAGRSAVYVFGVWVVIAIASGVASWVGYALFQNVSSEWVAATTAIAAGAILSMLADTMIPEAFQKAHMVFARCAPARLWLEVRRSEIVPVMMACSHPGVASEIGRARNSS